MLSICQPKFSAYHFLNYESVYHYANFSLRYATIVSEFQPETLWDSIFPP